MAFTPQVHEMRFLMEAISGAPMGPGGDGLDDATITLMLEQAGQFASEVLAPLNIIGDRQGAQWSAGAVTMPPGFKEAYVAFSRAGWPAAGGPPEFDGMGLPLTVATMLLELWTTANMAFAMAPTLNSGAAETLQEHAAEALEAGISPEARVGEWTATMALTEAHAGSDLSELRTIAKADSDGAFRLFGSKIFITFGEHDMAANIVHLVLARLADAPAGSRGISLFLVPKFLPDASGAATIRNNVLCTGVEHKMGIKGSPTCSLSFGEDGGGAKGWLIGQQHQGLACMFTMMNRARLATGLQGLGIAERATQSAYAFARARVQGRAPGEDGPGPIILHPDVQRMLLDMRSQTLAGRCLAYFAATAIDCATSAAPEERRRWASRAALLTPMVKAWCTQSGFDVASLCIQVHGGMGYVEETGVSQLLRDARIALIYEGSNGIQAIDLIARKILRDQGAAAFALLDELSMSIRASEPQARLASAKSSALAALETMGQIVAWTIAAERTERERLAAASPVLDAFASAVCAALLLKAAGRDVEEQPKDIEAAARHFINARLRPAVTAALGALSSVAVETDDYAMSAYC